MISKEAYKYDKYLASNTGSRWASDEEIKKDSVRLDLSKAKYPVAGIPLISDGKVAYVDGQDRHTLVWGSTGSKKTRLFVFPLTNICIKAGESFVVMDPKGEIYKNSVNTAKENGYDIKVLNLRDLGYGNQWNPLSIPYHLYKEGRQDEATSMIDDFIKVLLGDRLKEKDIFWPQMAARYLTAHINFLFKYADESDINLKSIARMCSADVEPHLKNMLKYMDPNSEEAVTYSVILNLAQGTKTSVTSYAYSMVSMFASQQQLANALAKDTFCMKNIGKKKTAVYIIVPDEKSTYHFLASLFVKQLYEAMIDSAQKNADRKIKVRMNFILDEFCNMPTIPDMVSMITAARSRNMRFFLFVQGMHQLIGKYGEDAETIKGNCDNWCFLNSRELSLLNEICELCGKKRIGGREESLLSVERLQHLNKEKGECLIFYARNYPMLSTLADFSEYKMFDNPDEGFVIGDKFDEECGVVNVKNILDLQVDLKNKKDKEDLLRNYFDSARPKK